MLGSAHLDAQLGAQLRAMLVLSSCFDSGLTTRDSAWLDSALSSAYLDRSPARLTLAKLISARIFFFLKEAKHRVKQK